MRRTVAGSVLAALLLAGCGAPAGDDDPLPTGDDTTTCDVAREAFLTGTPAEIEAALKALIEDESADAIAREYAQHYLVRDAADQTAQDADKALIQAACLTLRRTDV
jgi:hypothetical protein